MSRDSLYALQSPVELPVARVLESSGTTGAGKKQVKARKTRYINAKRRTSSQNFSENL